jgi:TonB family protein
LWARVIAPLASCAVRPAVVHWAMQAILPRVACMVAACTVAAGVVAQEPPTAQALVVEVDGKPQFVRDVHNGFYLYERDGKLVSAPRGSRTTLAPMKAFLPFFVSVRDLEAKSHTLNVTMNGSSGEMNPEFEFRAKFESGFRLDRFFYVLELDSEELGKRVFADGVGTIEPRVPRSVHIRVPIVARLGAGKFKLHLFSDGLELLHSQQPPLFRERQLDRMVQARIKGEQDAPVRPFIGPLPEYPKQFLKRRINGEAVVRFRVSRTGAVLDPVLRSASTPEFGESALAAARLWRFLPKVQSGRPVESEVALPFTFEPPPEEK